MKVISFFFFFILLASIHSSYACLNDIETARADRFISQHFKNDTYVTHSSKFSEVNAEFEKHLESFSNNAKNRQKLAYYWGYYGQFLLSHRRNDGMQWLSSAINAATASDLKQNDLLIFFLAQTGVPAPLEQTNAPSSASTALPPRVVMLKPYIEDITTFLKNPNTYALNKGFLQPSHSDMLTMSAKTKSKVSQSILEAANELMNLTKRCSIDCYDALLTIVVDNIKQNDYPETAMNLIKQQYNQDKAQASPRLKFSYAIESLIPNNQFQEAILLLEGVLGKTLTLDNLYQHQEGYLGLAYCYHAMARPKLIEPAEGEAYFSMTEGGRGYINKALAALNTASFLEEADRWNLKVYQVSSWMHLFLGQSQQAYEMIQPLMNASEEQLAEAEINIYALRKNYAFILNKAGKNEELKEFFFKRKENFVNKNKRMAEIIKSFQAQRQKEMETAQCLEQERQEKLQQRRQVSHSTHSTSITDELPEDTATLYQPVSSATTDRAQPASSANSNSVQPKEKVKTRGVPRQEPAAPILQPIQAKPLLFIEQLTKNKQAIKTFYLFFAKYRPDVRSDSNVKISMNKTSCMFDALEQDDDESQGHGSHRKVTTNFQKFGSAAAEQVTILSHKNHLIPDQIKDIRDVFLDARILPNDPELIKKLKEEGSLE